MIKRQEAQKELQGDGREKEVSREKRLLCNLWSCDRTRDQEALSDPSGRGVWRRRECEQDYRATV